jgi:hypothetical protein
MMWERGLSTEWKRLACPDPEGAHNALVDAKWNLLLYMQIMGHSAYGDFGPTLAKQRSQVMLHFQDGREPVEGRFQWTDSTKQNVVFLIDQKRTPYVAGIDPISAVPAGQKLPANVQTSLHLEEPFVVDSKKREEILKALETKVGEAVGHASMCWNPRPGDLVFDSTEAAKVVENLMQEIKKLI